MCVVKDELDMLLAHKGTNARAHADERGTAAICTDDDRAVMHSQLLRAMRTLQCMR
jgi:hypothetical protein